MNASINYVSFFPSIYTLTSAFAIKISRFSQQIRLSFVSVVPGRKYSFKLITILLYI